ncbi:alcohol oxidase [Aspergillus steynii IBT 23096]|uniref:Alcohol oxidase n=1 Tax=Aspergillus steynii IBT 23096 TaxID=1392250 RepID=A0A2I2GST9_9EURO|nr:alcohol oxidase [Aspergillus steynii IBT 23096]PLB55930.1 alcohol oxidase [Aspergillus steynii IBT 23096]
MALLRAFSFLSLLAASTATGPFEAPATSLGTPGKDASYDYVVVGGGTAGLTIAGRLAQEGGFTVAVVEAGGFYQLNGNLSVIPAFDIWYAGASPDDTNPNIDWGFVTSPQAGMNNREIHYARGKCLSGSSARNYMTYHCGTTDSYSKWATEVDDSSYELSNFWPYFQKTVNFTQPDNERRAANASIPETDRFASGSPLQVSHPVYANPFSSWVKKALQYMGFKEAKDFVSGELSGVQYNMVTVDPRWSTRSSAEEFVRSIGVADNFKIYNGTLAQKLVFKGTTATGVKVTTSGKDYTLSAKKEVIVSAGAFQSPQLLMVSGVGPADILEEFDIPVISELAGVGQNMWDHLLFGLSYQVTTPSHSAVGNAEYLAQATEEYLADGSGMLGNPGGDIVAWEKLAGKQLKRLSADTQCRLGDSFPSDWPEVEYITLDAYMGNNQNYITGAPQTPYMYVSPAASLVSPFSRGNLTIASASMEDDPIINPNWLTDTADQELAILAVKRIREMVDTDIMKNVIVGTEVYPGRDKVSTDAEILNFVRDNGIQIFHAAATCKMGTSKDPLAVVDSQGRVFGTSQLRVVDASAFPFLPPGHPQATVYALAEKIAADIIGK